MALKTWIDSGKKSTLANIFGGYENASQDPSLKNPSSTSSASGLYQFQYDTAKDIINREGRYKNYPDVATAEEKAIFNGITNKADFPKIFGQMPELQERMFHEVQQRYIVDEVNKLKKEPNSKNFSDLELASITSNPWQIFEPIAETIWIPDAVSGGTVYTLSPGGTVSFTGTSPELREKMLTPSGSFVLSGFSSFLREHAYLPSGTVSFSGTAPISQAATYVLSISGSVVFSGSTEYQRTKVQGASGTVSFTGTYAPLHEKTYAPSGTVVFSGTATGNKIRVFSPTGEITFLGSAPIINPNAPAGQGTWRTLTGMGQ